MILSVALSLLSSFMLSPDPLVQSIPPSQDSVKKNPGSVNPLKEPTLSSFIPATQLSMSASAPLSPNPLFGRLLLIYGDYENESGQESISVWINLFEEIGFNCIAIHINTLPIEIDYDLLVVTPSIGTSDATFGVSLIQAQAVVSQEKPVLLLGYAHEVLDLLMGFVPYTDFIPCIESYLWTTEPSIQIFSLPHAIPIVGNRLTIYANHVSYDAYRVTSLPTEVEVLGTNFDGSGSQILWYRSLANQPFLYYWGLDQVTNLNPHGVAFCENFIHWLIRPVLQERIGSNLAGYQLTLPPSGDYWAVQGAGGFGYPLEPSLTYSYYLTDLVQTFSLDVNLTAFSSWFMGCYNPLLGCFEDLASPQLQDRCIVTGMSVLTAHALGILDQLNGSQIGNYLASCQDSSTGGFFTELGISQTSQKATRYAIEALVTLGQLDKINNTAAIAYITASQDTNPQSSQYGGFYSAPSDGLATSLVYSVDALTTLSHLGAINTINQTALLSFVLDCEEPSGSGIFDTKQVMDSDEWIQGTACAIQILDILDAIGSFNVPNGRAFILDHQFPNGGWGRGDRNHDFHNSPDETWYAVQGLSVTGGLASSGAALTQYIGACCTGWGGATEPAFFGDFLTSTHFISALHQADALNTINLTAVIEFFDNCWSATRVSFSAHQLPSTVGTDTDIPTPDRIALESNTFGPLYHYAYAQLMGLLNLTGSHWSTRTTQILQEIKTSQTFAAGYEGMFGFHHLYVGQETDITFRFDTTCWSLLAHQTLGGQPSDLLNASAALSYLLTCLQGNSTHQYFNDTLNSTSLPAPWLFAEGYLAETWLGLQACAYLDPTLSGLNGEQIATFTNQYLQNNPDIVTAFYATEILYLLAETNLYPAALNLINREALKSLLINALSYSGLITEPAIPRSKWTPYLVDLGYQLINRLHLFPYLDSNPILNLTQFSLPNGTLSVNTAVFFSAFVNETRWGVLPHNISVSALIFDTIFINSSHPSTPYLWEVQDLIPTLPSALGPQNLTLLATAPGAIPWRHHFANICEVWGNIKIQSTCSPGLTIPRSIPLNLSIQLGLDTGTGPHPPLTNGFISVILDTGPDIYYPSHQGLGRYETFIPTHALAPQDYTLKINATIPYCPPNMMTTLVSIIMFETYLTNEPTIPRLPILWEDVSVPIGLWNDGGSPLNGYEIRFNIIRPGETSPTIQANSTTNPFGVATCQWQPDTVGHWQLTYSFAGQDMYHPSHGSTGVDIKRRLMACAIQQFPSDTLFIGNQTLIHIQVTDDLNGLSLSNLLVNLYEDQNLLATAITNGTGHATCQWLISGPVGLRTLRLEIAETITHESWTTTDITYHIMDTTTLEITKNTSTLFLGETIYLEVHASASESGLPNGTASVFWDGLWHHNFQIDQGVGTTTLAIAYSEFPGDHFLIVLFGHLEIPDTYTECSSEIIVTLLPVKLSTLFLTINPLEIDDIYSTPTITIHVQLTYLEDSIVYGFSANVSIHLIGPSSTTIYEAVIATDENGYYILVLSTPPPGLYTVAVSFDGQRGFAPCSQTMPFLVHSPFNHIESIFSPMILVSIAIIVIGGFTGTFVFFRLQRRVNRITQLFLPRQEFNTESSEIIQSLLENQLHGSPTDRNDE